MNPRSRGAPDLAGIAALPLIQVPSGTSWVRIHLAQHGALWFGPRTERPRNRFDDPERTYKVCYLGATLEASFVETVLHEPPVPIVSLSDLALQRWTELRVVQPLRLVQLHSHGFARLYTSSVIASGDHRHSRVWRRALWEHPEAPDGIEYRSSHDDSTFSIALFDRAKDALEVGASHVLGVDRHRLAQLAARYGFAVEP